MIIKCILQPTAEGRKLYNYNILVKNLTRKEKAVKINASYQKEVK